MRKTYLLALFFVPTLYAKIDVGPAEWEEAKIKHAAKEGPPPKQIGLYISTELLYFQAQENGLTYAIKSQNGEGLLNDAKGQNPHFSWDFGSKIGLGYIFHRDCWDLSSSWTRFYTKASSHEDAGDEHVIFSTWTHPQSNSPFSQSEAHWHLALNLLDLTLSRCFAIGQKTSLCPSLSLYSAWLNRKYRMTFESEKAHLQNTSTLRNNFWGFGPGFGIRAMFRLAPDWSLFGEGTLGLLLGNFQLKQREWQNHQEIYETDNSFRNTLAFINTEMGIGWDRLLIAGRLHILLQIAWENTLFLNENQSMHFTDNISPATFVQNQGNLSIQGWKASLSMKF